MFDYQCENIVENFVIFLKIQHAQTTTSQNSTLEERTATKRTPAIELPPTDQETGTKTPPIIQKTATIHYWPLKDNHHQPKIKIKKKKKKKKKTR